MPLVEDLPRSGPEPRLDRGPSGQVSATRSRRSK